MPSTSKFFNTIGLAAVLASAARHPASGLVPVESPAPEQTPEQSTMDPGESLYPALHAYVAVAAMTRAGFVINSSDPNADNPRYEVRLSDELAPQLVRAIAQTNAEQAG